MDGERDIPLLHHAVGGVRDLAHEHIVVLAPEAVQRIARQGQENLLLEVLAVQTTVVDGNLGGRAGVQRVQKFAVAQEHGGLVLFGRDGVIDVGEADGFGEFIPVLKNPVRKQTADGNAVLYRSGEEEALPVLSECVLQGLNQAVMPP